MGASESVHNDYTRSVTVWWQHRGVAHEVQVLDPGGYTTFRMMKKGKAHNLCAQYGSTPIQSDNAVCMPVDALSGHRTYKVQRIMSHQGTPQDVPVEYLVSAAFLALAALILTLLGLKKCRSSKTQAPDSPSPRSIGKGKGSQSKTTEGHVLSEPFLHQGEQSTAGQVLATEVAPRSILKTLADNFCNLFAVWLTLAAVGAIVEPSTFTWIPDEAFTGLLGLLMFSAGIKSTFEDFKKTLTKPVVIGVNFLLCFGAMPAVAYATGMLMGAEGSILTGLVLVGAINGGQASTLCTLIAGGDVALSVLMTTSTTLGCIVMTPLICKMVLGKVVPVNALGMVLSCIEVVLIPIFLGVGFNTMAPKLAKGMAPYTPVAGVIATALLVGAMMAKSQKPIVAAGIPLQLACLNIHVVGGILGYYAMSVLGFNRKTCRTVAIQVSMKSSALAVILAAQNFRAFNVRVPGAVDTIWMSITGCLMAIYWKFMPLSDDDNNTGRKPSLQIRRLFMASPKQGLVTLLESPTAYMSKSPGSTVTGA